MKDRSRPKSIFLIWRHETRLGDVRLKDSTEESNCLGPGFFIGIGAARAGTTWLYSMLQKRKEIYLPPVKELQYFNWTLEANREDFPEWKELLVDLKCRLLGKRAQTRLLNYFYQNSRAGDFYYSDKSTTIGTKAFSSLPDDIARTGKIHQPKRQCQRIRSERYRSWRQVRALFSYCVTPSREFGPTTAIKSERDFWIETKSSQH